MSQSKINFVEKFYKDEVENLKKRGNYWGFQVERVNKNYKKDMAVAKKDANFDNIIFQEAYNIYLKQLNYENY